jgi:pentatricopeptide repeat protein
MMEELRIDPNAQTFARLIGYYKRSNDAEEASRCLAKMKAMGIEPDRVTRDLMALGTNNGGGQHQSGGGGAAKLSAAPQPSFLNAILATNGTLGVEEADLEYEASPDEWIE